MCSQMLIYSLFCMCRLLSYFFAFNFYHWKCINLKFKRKLRLQWALSRMYSVRLSICWHYSRKSFVHTKTDSIGSKTIPLLRLVNCIVTQNEINDHRKPCSQNRIIIIIVVTMLFCAENHKQRTRIHITTKSLKQQNSSSETMSCGGRGGGFH